MVLSLGPSREVPSPLHSIQYHGLVANVLGIETFIFGRFLLYVPTTPPYKTPSQPMRAPRMWGVERDPRASLGRRGAHGDGLVGVFQGGVRGRGGVAHAAPWAPRVGGEMVIFV